MRPFTLRPLAETDLDALVALDSDPEVMRFINGGQATPRALCAEVLLPRMLSQATQPGLGFFAVESPDQAFMGWVHLRLDTFEPAWAELGYRLARPWWGQGIATAASRLLTARAFDELGFDVVSARAMPENGASRRVMEKVGLREAGRFVFPGRVLAGLRLQEVPGVLYTLRREDWSAREGEANAVSL
jgi:RimJ/RimL family protein N-acetyltransferase